MGREGAKHLSEEAGLHLARPLGGVCLLIPVLANVGGSALEGPPSTKLVLEPCALMSRKPRKLSVCLLWFL